MTDQPKVVHRSWKMTDADTTTQSSDTKPQQLDTSGEVQPKVVHTWMDGVSIMWQAKSDGSLWARDYDDEMVEDKTVTYGIGWELARLAGELAACREAGREVTRNGAERQQADASADKREQPKVVRWRVSQNVYGEYKWAPRDDGEWVGYEYYARLAGELEEQVEESRMWMKRCDRRAERARELEQAILSTLTHLPAENMCHAIEYISQALRGDE